MTGRRIAAALIQQMVVEGVSKFDASYTRPSYHTGTQCRW